MAGGDSIRLPRLSSLLLSRSLSFPLVLSIECRETKIPRETRRLSHFARELVASVAPSSAMKYAHIQSVTFLRESLLNHAREQTQLRGVFFLPVLSLSLFFFFFFFFRKTHARTRANPSQCDCRGNRRETKRMKTPRRTSPHVHARSAVSAAVRRRSTPLGRQRRRPHTAAQPTSGRNSLLPTTFYRPDARFPPPLDRCVYRCPVAELFLRRRCYCRRCQRR